MGAVPTLQRAPYRWAMSPSASTRWSGLSVEPDHLELSSPVERVLAPVVPHPRGPRGHVLRVRRVDVVDAIGGVPLDVVDDLLAGRSRGIAALSVQHHVEVRVGDVAPVVGQPRPKEVVEIAVDFRKRGRGSPARLVELAEKRAPDVAPVVLVHDLELHADLLEALGEMLELLDVLRPIAWPVRTLDLHAVGKARLGQDLLREGRIVLKPFRSLSQLGCGELPLAHGRGHGPRILPPLPLEELARPLLAV